jgi:hypothetical protein
MTILGRVGHLWKMAILILAVLLAVGSSCQAWWPSGWCYPGGIGGYVPWLSDLERLPYFALHPPVYYSRPVPRTYGYTPFASLPDSSIFETIQAQPAPVRNPYVIVVGADGTAVSSDSAPLIVKNPFVDRPVKGGAGKKKAAAK